jgi:hypothetical protein
VTGHILDVGDFKLYLDGLWKILPMVPAGFTKTDKRKVNYFRRILKKLNKPGRILCKAQRDEVIERAKKIIPEKLTVSEQRKSRK